MCDMTAGGLCEWHVMANIGLKRLQLGFWGIRTIYMHIKASLSWWFLKKKITLTGRLHQWSTLQFKVYFLLLKYFTNVLFIWGNVINICLGRCDFLTAEQLTQLPGGPRTWFVKIHDWKKKIQCHPIQFKNTWSPWCQPLHFWDGWHFTWNKINLIQVLLPCSVIFRNIQEAGVKK